MKKLLLAMFCVLFAVPVFAGSIGIQDFHNWDGDTGDSTFTRTTSGGYTVTLHDVGYVVDVLMAHGGGVNYNRTTVNNALTAIGTSANVGMLFAPGKWTFTSGITIPINVTSIFPSGVSLVPSSGISVWIRGPILAGNYPLFDTSASGSTVILLDAALDQVRYQAWNGTGNDIYVGPISINNSVASVFIDSTSLTTPFAVGPPSGQTLFAISSNGYLGIDKYPSSKLDVDGESALDATVRVRAYDDTGYANFRVSASDGLAGNIEGWLYAFGANYISSASRFVTSSVLLDGRGSGGLGLAASADGADITFWSGNTTRMTISNSGINIGTGVSNPGGGVTSFIAIASGVSPPVDTPIANGAGFYVVSDNMWVMSANGDNTQISPHDPDTGEWYYNSYNIFTGKGFRYYFLSGISVPYTVDKVNPSVIAKKIWIKNYMENTLIEVPVKDAFETVEDAYEITVTKSIPNKFKIINGEIKPYSKNVESTIKVVKGLKKVLRSGYIFNENTGKIYRKPSKIEANELADKDFKFNWASVPKYIRDVWEK